MKLRRKIICIILSASLLLGGIVYSSAANVDISEVSAKTGALPIGNGITPEPLPSTYKLLPESYSSAEEGYTLPVRQQHFDTCWAFGTLSSFETLLLKNGEDVSPLAPQHMNFWATAKSDSTGWQRTYKDGGYSYIPLGYLSSWSGPVNEADFPELESTRTDYDNFTKAPEYVLTEAIFFNSDSDRNSIKSLIYEYGSVVGSFNADMNNYCSYNNSFYCADATLSVSELKGHCVSVVGWDDTYEKDNFAESKSGTPKSDGAWLIKNSWSSYSGDDGFFWVSYEDVWMFNSIFGPSFALTGYEKKTDGLRIYQNEFEGATYEFNYLSSHNADMNIISSDIAYMNAFDFAEEHRTLDKVVFECSTVGLDYSIYYIPFNGDTPTVDAGQWTKLYSGTVDYSGYICADFEDVLLPAGKGAIGVRISNERYNEEHPSEKIDNTIGVCEWLSTGANKIYIPQSKDGMSYYMIMNRRIPAVNDVMNLYRDSLSDDIGGTFTIKAITRNEETVVPTTQATDPTESTTAALPTETTASSSATLPLETTTAPSTRVPQTFPPKVTIPGEVKTDPTETTVPSTSLIPLPGKPFFYKLGDANLDGTVNIKDATVIQKAAAKIIELTNRQSIASDVTGDGRINVIDSTNIQKFSAGIPTEFDIGKDCIHIE